MTPAAPLTFAQLQLYMLRTAVVLAIEEHKSIRRAARALGIPRSTLFDLCKQFKIETPWHRNDPRQKEQP